MLTVRDQAVLQNSKPPVIPVGGVYRVTPITYTDGMGVVNHYDVNGNLKVVGDLTLAEFPIAAAISGENNTAPSTTSVYAYGMVFDGSNWDRMPGNSTNGVTVTESRTAASTVSSVASSASNVTLFAANAARRMATIFNESSQILYAKIGSATASLTSYTVAIAPGGYYEVPAPVCTGIIDGIWASANGNARLTEW